MAEKDDYQNLFKVCHRLDELKTFVATLPHERKELLFRAVLSHDGRVCHPLRSPLTEIACCPKRDHLDIVQYLVEEFNDIVDINHGGSLDSSILHNPCALVSKHHLFETVLVSVPPLVAACTYDRNVKMIDYLISKGADPNKQALYWGTPLCVAAQYGCVSVMKYLMDTGLVDINATNYRGCTPLMMVCGLGMPLNKRFDPNKIDDNDEKKHKEKEETLDFVRKSICFLLRNGADPHVKTPQGYTLMHTAAYSGRLDIIMVLLEEKLEFPLFSTTGSGCLHDDVPCPLYLAASNGHDHIVQFFSALPDCPPLCKGNALLLLATYHKYTKLGRSREFWEEGLKIFEEHNVKPVYLTPGPEYDYEQEISSKAELDAVYETEQFRNVHYHYQKFLIMERCLGLSYSKLPINILQDHFGFVQAGQDLSGLFRHALEALKHQKSVDFNHDVFHSTMLVAVASDVLQEKCRYAEPLRYVTEIGLVVLEQMVGLSWYKSDFACTAILFCFAKWFTCILQENPSAITNMSVQADLLHEFHDLGRRLMSLNQYLSDNTFVHFLIRLCDRRHTNIDKFFGIVLSTWEGNKIVNCPNTTEGKRPLHLALERKEVSVEMISVFLSNGAHVDAVDANGKTAFDYCSTGTSCHALISSFLPLSLLCCASKAIVSGGIPYQCLNLPKHVVSFIQLHDPQSIKVTKNLMNS